jgi:hypothetical protein
MTNRHPVSRWQPIKLLKLTNFERVTIFAQEMNLGRQNMYSIHKTGRATKSCSENFPYSWGRKAYLRNTGWVDLGEPQTFQACKQNVCTI